MFLKLITQSFRMFRRSELYGRSMFVIILLGFFAFFILGQLSLAGRILPALLQEHFPQHQPAEWVYGFLLPILLTDIWLRLFIQSTAASQVRPYVHLPVSRSVLSAYWILRSWLHPINLYLLVFFHSFIRMTINPESGSHALGLLAIALLVAFSQGILMWIKSMQNKINGFVAIGITTLVFTWIYTYHMESVIALSVKWFVQFTQGHTPTILVWAALPAAIHLVVFLKGKQGFYHIFDEGSRERTVSGSNRIERIIASVPGFGPYWLLEWQLASRSRRSKWNFYLMIPYAIAFILFFLLTGNVRPGTFVILFFLIAGSYGGFHLQHAFSWESHFFDFLATRNISLYHFIRAKFWFFLTYAVIQMMVILPILAWIDPEVILFYVAIFLYACGFGYFFYLWTGVGNSARLNANGSASFNMEGVTGIKFIQVMVLFLSIVPLFLIGRLLPIPNGHYLLPGIIGLAFILTHQWWIRSIVRKFEKKKYIKLNLYRQK